MSTVETGNKLEDELYSYLQEQQTLGQLVYGLYAPSHCEVFKKKRYYCVERRRHIEFDIVVEVFRVGSDQPHLFVIFECKNHKSPISESAITDFSDKLGRIFRHNAKGVVVSSTRLQSGAQRVASNRGIGIVKYDSSGFDVIAERRGGLALNQKFVESQIFQKLKPEKSLKFSAYFDGNFSGTVNQFFASLDKDSLASFGTGRRVPYVSTDTIREKAQQLRGSIGYTGGAVDLRLICAELSLSLEFTSEKFFDVDSNSILGLANFSNRSIRINFHEDKFRKRFTLAHEIGHFALCHDRYLSSEAVIESDLFTVEQDEPQFDYHRLETQANMLASEILLPQEEFNSQVAHWRDILDIQDRGHGYIFVDNQACNYVPYQQLLLGIQAHFEVSKRAIEIKLKLQRMLNDERQPAGGK